MPTFSEQAAANLARTGGVQAQLQMGRDKIGQAQFAAEMAAQQRADDIAAQQFAQEMNFRQQELANQQAWRDAQIALDRERMGISQSQWGQEFGLSQAEADRAAQLHELELAQLQREAGDTGVGFFEGTGLDQQTINLRARQYMAQGMPQNEAMMRAVDDIRSAQVSTYFDPVTGERVTQRGQAVFGYGQPAPYDIEPAAGDVAPAGQVQQRRGPTLWELAPIATGLGSGAKEAWARTFGQIPFVGIDEETIQARQTLTTAQAGLVRALAQSSRYTQDEQKMIRGEISLSPDWMDSPRALQARMRSIDTSLRTRLADEERAINDKSLPAKERQDAAVVANEMKNYLNILGVPQAGGGREVPVINTPAEARNLPSGTVFRTPDGRTLRVP